MSERGLWPGLAIGLLLAGMGASSTFAWIAVNNAPAVVARDLRDATSSYNRMIRDTERAVERELELGLRVRSTPTGVHIEADWPLDPGARVTVRRIRPAEADAGAEVELVQDARTFQGELELPRAGRWQLLVRAELGDARRTRIENWVHAP